MQTVVNNIPIEIHKKNIKNMHLYVKPPEGTVSISAPFEMSDNAIELFIRTKISWIKKQQNKFDTQLRQSERSYISGETFYLWGKQYFIQVEYSTKNSLVLTGNKAILYVRKESTSLQRQRFINKWYREKLKEEITRILPKWEKLTGLHCESWQTKYMTTKWGSCNTNSRKLWFNLQLVKKTPECLEYVILHELVHLQEKTHNENFSAIMDKHMPYWRDIRYKLNAQILDYLE